MKGALIPPWRTRVTRLMNERFLFDASLRVRHPSMAAAQIVDMFGWEPQVAQSVHEQRRTKVGTLLAGDYKQTYLSFPLETGDHDRPEDFLWAHLAEPDSRDQLAIARAIEAGCSVTYAFGISCPGSSGFELEAKLIEAIHCTGVSLSFYLYGFA